MDGPFNADERAAQHRAGGGPPGHGIRDAMPQQHRDFFERLPYVFVGLVDERGWPIATLLTGAPGFIAAPDDGHLRIDAQFDPGDPAGPGAVAGRPIALLGLDYATRRRNRANGVIEAADANGLAVSVAQSFGNCPQYIPRRQLRPIARPQRASRRLAGLDDAAIAVIRGADSLFVASRARAALGRPHGADISHRGGAPGFVRVEGDRLTIPDYRGNRYFNTLGNLLGKPRAALLFADVATGDMLQLQGRAEILWTPADDIAADADPAAERLWHFTVTAGWHRPGAVALAAANG